MKSTLFSLMTMCLLLCNCTNNSNTNSIAQENILGTWNILHANGLRTDSTETKPFIHFGDSGVVNGHASVNTFFGQYELRGDSILLNQMGATTMIEHDMDVEIAIMNALGQCVTLEIQDSVLSAKDGDGNIVMVMVRGENLK